jgi:ABC-2 type transport system permease protein
MRRILFLARAEVLHVVRDRATLVQVLVMPIVQLLILSNAVTFAIRNTPAYIVDLDRSITSRGLVNRFAASRHFRIVGQSASSSLAYETLLEGNATLVLTIPADFESALVHTGAASVQLGVNAEKGSAAGIVQSYASRILRAYALEIGPAIDPRQRRVADASSERPPIRGEPQIEIEIVGRYNPTLNYHHYMVPGLLVALVTMIGTLLTAQNIAREKELGTIEQLNVTPISRGQFITAKLLPFWILGLIDLALGLAVGWLAFDMPIRGSLLLLFGAAAIYLVVALALGLWVSTLVDTQQQAMFVTFFIINVYLLMSGLFTPIDSMAPWVRVLSELNPVRHFVMISRAVLLKGAGPAEMARPLLILTAYAVIMLTVAVRQYSKRTL